MAKAYVDHVETLELEERNGAIVSLTTLIRVCELENTNAEVLLDALEAAGVPASGFELSGKFAGMILTERNPRLVDKSTVDVRCTYSLPLNNQEIGGRVNLYGTARCSVAQKTTNFYVPYGGSIQPLQSAQQITVEHTYPADDPDFPGRTVIQGGEVTVFVPEANYYFEGFLNTYNPWASVAVVLGKINSGIWLSQAPLCWMCTEVQFSMIKPGRYKFRFEFQLNLDTWDPSVVFIDERTGRPPAGLVPGVGYKTIPYHARINFSAAFGSYFEGWQQVF